ncbi:hypothetical protein [Salinarchaeum chitinilyticum]
MERSVQLIVAGGLAILAGLWLLAAGDRIGQWYVGGIPVALAGAVLLAVGIARDLTHGPFAE